MGKGVSGGRLQRAAMAWGTDHAKLYHRLRQMPALMASGLEGQLLKFGQVSNITCPLN